MYINDKFKVMTYFFTQLKNLNINIYITYNPNFLKFLKYKKKKSKVEVFTINNCMLPKLSLSLWQLI